MLGDRQQQARFHSDFYRDSYYKILNALIFSCVVIVCLIAGIVYLILHQPTPRYYATTSGGQIISMSPIS